VEHWLSVDLKENSFLILRYDLDQIKDTLQSLITNKRYQHSLRVGDVCKSLADHYNYDIDKAYLAGLIHDAAKDLDPFTSDISLTDFQKSLYENFTPVAHAFALSSVVDRCFFNIPEDIIQSAQWHTTGKENMTLLEKIVFVADFIEPERFYFERNVVENLAYQSLDKAVGYIAWFKLNYLVTAREPIYLKLLDCYNFYNKNSE